jgi:beta-fructofuranosidase
MKAIFSMRVRIKMIIYVLLGFVLLINGCVQKESAEYRSETMDMSDILDGSSETLLEDATAVWHMSRADSVLAGPLQVSVHGNIQLGVELNDSEHEASLIRGGDGKVANFEGGYLIAGNEVEEALQLKGDKLTICIRLRDTAGRWDTPLFSRMTPDDPYGKILYSSPLNKSHIGYPHIERIKTGNSIEFLWRTTPIKERVRPEYLTQENSSSTFGWHTKWEAENIPSRKGDFNNGLLHLNAPIDLIGEDDWHDIIVRFDRENLEMFIDGVLIDEEWPHGNLFNFKGPFLIGAGYEDGMLLSGFEGQIDHVALWDRALRDDEIVLLSGGAEEVARRDIEILGERKNPGQYWRPHGYNTSIGDCMAFSHDGTYHVFFLSVRRYGASKWGLMATPWGHISTKDFVHWEEHPCPLDITEPWECCLGTGSFVYHEGKYYLFYIKHDRRAWFSDNPNFGDAVFMATSDDCIHFEKEFSPLFVPGWFKVNDINPNIYVSKTDGSYILSLSNWKVLQSKDLRHWEIRDNLTIPPWWVCTSYFQWNDWDYFCSCGYYYMSKKPIEDPMAEWARAPKQTINDGIRVPQMAKLNDRYISVGFTPEPPGGYYGGELLVRELIQEPDGTLGSKWVEEMIPESGDQLKLSFEAIAGRTVEEEASINISAPNGFAAGSIINVPQNVRITVKVKPETGTKEFGLCVRGKGKYESGCKLQFEPTSEHVLFAPIAKESSEKKKNNNWKAIDGVNNIDSAFTLDIIVKDDLVDACIGNRHTIITRNHEKLNGDRLFFFVDHGEVTFEEIQVRPLLGE